MGKRGIPRIKRIILLVVDRIVRLISALPLRRILLGNHRIRLRAKLKMLMLDDTRIRNLPLRIINHRISLIVVTAGKQFLLKTQGTVLQLSKGIIKIFVYHTGV